MKRTNSDIMFEKEHSKHSLKHPPVPFDDVDNDNEYDESVGSKKNKSKSSSMETGKASIQSSSEVTNAGSRRGPSPSSTFPAKLHEILSCSEFRHIVTWMPHGSSWRVLQPKLFEEIVMPKYFAQQSKYSSFTRQVNGWGFRRITQGKDRNCYCHPLFRENMPHLTRIMKRQSTSTSKKAMENVTNSHSNLNRVDDSQAYNSDNPDYHRPQLPDYPSSYWRNNDSQYYESDHQNSHYYYPQESQQVSHSDVPHHDYYDYTNHQNNHNVATYQQPYHKTYQVPEHDYFNHYDNKSHTPPTPQPGQYNGGYNETDQYGYHPHNQYYQQQHPQQHPQQHEQQYQQQYQQQHEQQYQQQYQQHQHQQHQYQQEQYHDNYESAQTR